jgi:hypothetical protein
MKKIFTCTMCDQKFTLKDCEKDHAKQLRSGEYAIWCPTCRTRRYDLIAFLNERYDGNTTMVDQAMALIEYEVFSDPEAFASLLPLVDMTARQTFFSAGWKD